MKCLVSGSKYSLETRDHKISCELSRVKRKKLERRLLQWMRDSMIWESQTVMRCDISEAKPEELIADLIDILDVDIGFKRINLER